MGRLRDAVRESLDDPRFVAVGEIGIDLFEPRDVPRQERFFREQLRIARDFGLPVIVHVRRSADLLLKHLRRIEVPGGIIHAFNGSTQQADQFLARGFKLGLGFADLQWFAADTPARRGPTRADAGARDRCAVHRSRVAAHAGRRGAH